MGFCLRADAAAGPHVELCQQRAWQPGTAEGGTANGPVTEAFGCPRVPAREAAVRWAGGGNCRVQRCGVVEVKVKCACSSRVLCCPVL